jgi:hypothetical protein
MADGRPGSFIIPSLPVIEYTENVLFSLRAWRCSYAEWGVGECQLVAGIDGVVAVSHDAISLR